jgi:hypothetical protein
MITHSNGESFKIAGSEINKRNQAVIASTTTMTGAPLKTAIIVRVYFTADITGSNTTTGLVINYNNVNYNVKVPKNGTLANFVASDLGGSPAVYKYLQANTMLELLYDGTQFIIIGNPVVLSSRNYTIYADGYLDNTNGSYLITDVSDANLAVGNDKDTVTFYTYFSSMQNTPNTGSFGGWLITFRYRNTTNIKQIWMNYTDSNGSEYWDRFGKIINNSYQFSNWRKIN